VNSYETGSDILYLPSYGASVYKKRRNMVMYIWKPCNFTEIYLYLRGIPHVSFLQTVMNELLLKGMAIQWIYGFHLTGGKYHRTIQIYQNQNISPHTLYNILILI